MPTGTVPRAIAVSAEPWPSVTMRSGSAVDDGRAEGVLDRHGFEVAVGGLRGGLARTAAGDDESRGYEAGQQDGPASGS
ncbi:hypothetical protein GS914_23970 [Rhodococcus hoagii]|nr:hypothetical protein [Prescottella equi]